jgi:predicted ATPase
MLTSDLLSTAAESDGYLGNIESMERSCNEVLKQDISLPDKLRVYNVLVTNISNSGRNEEAVVFILGILRQLGCKFPKTKIARGLATLAGLVKARVTQNSRTAAEIAKMPTMKDSLQIETMKLVSKLSTCALLCGSDIFLLAVLKNIRLTLRNGLSELSPPAFAGLAMVFTGVFGDFQTGSKIGDYTLLLLTKLESKVTFSRTHFVLSTFVFSWTAPFRSSSKSLLEAYEIGQKNGDTESATWVSMLVQ